MKFKILIFLFALLLTMANCQKTEPSNSRENHVYKKPIDHFLDGFLNIYKTKIDNQSMTPEDMKVLQYLLRLIKIRREQMDDEERTRPIVYWYLRQGRRSSITSK